MTERKKLSLRSTFVRCTKCRKFSQYTRNALFVLCKAQEEGGMVTWAGTDRDNHFGTQ